MRRLGFLMIGMLLFGVALPFHSYAQVRTQPARGDSTSLRDHNDNPLVTPAGERINYLDQPDGYFKAVLDADGAIVQREKLAANPFAEPARPQAGEQPMADQAGAPAPGPFLAETWRTGLWGTGIGLSGMIAQDLDNNGSVELILGGGYAFGRNYFWYIVAYLPDAGGYQQIWMSRAYNGVTINRIATADANQDGRLEIYVALSNGQLEIYDGPTRALKSTISTGLANLAAVLLADSDGDGSKELLVSSPSGTKAYAAATYAPRWQTSQGGADLAVANVDADSNLEIVVNGAVLDGSTRAVEWSFNFGSQLNVVDVDNDGKAEIIASQGWYKIFGFNAELKNRKWEIDTSLDIGALYVGDVDEDGVQEIVYGDNQWGQIHVLDGQTRQQEWQVGNPEHGVTRIAFGDIDGDGDTQLLWGAGWTSTGSDNLFVANMASRSIEWQSSDFIGPLHTMDVGDIDGDGRQEIVMIPYSGQSGLISIYDAQTHALESQLLNGPSVAGLKSLRLGDVDRDGRVDIVVATAAVYDGVVLAYDGLTHDLKWKSASAYGTAFNSLAIADVDNDGSVEVVGGQDAEHTGSTGAYVVVLDGQTGNEEWRTGSHGYWNGAKNIVVDDVNQDSHPDILFSMEGVAYLYDGVTRQNIWQGGSNISVVSSANVDSQPGPELLLGTTQGTLLVLDGTTRQAKSSVSIANTALTALRLGDMNRDGAAELFITSNGYLYVYDLATWSQIWQSDWLSNLVAERNHLVVRDIDGDRRDEVVLGTNEAVVEFSFSALPYLLDVQSTRQIVAPGQTISYTAALTNLTATSATLRLTNTLPLHTQLVSGSLQVPAGTATVDGGMVKWQVTLPPSSNMAMTLALAVSLDAPDGALLASTFSSDNGVFTSTRSETAIVDAIAPAVQVLGPTASAILSGTTALIHGTASDNRAGVERVEVQIGAGPWQAAQGTTSWAMTWTLPLSDTTVPLRFRALDRVGNLTAPLSETLVVVDNLAPRLLQTTPSHNALGVVRDQPILLTFSEPIDIATLSWSCQSDPGGWTITPLGDGRTLRLDHNQFEPNKLYSCYVIAADDQAGHAFQAGATANPWGFVTQNTLLKKLYLPGTFVSAPARRAATR